MTKCPVECSGWQGDHQIIAKRREEIASWSTVIIKRGRTMHSVRRGSGDMED